MDLPGPSSSTTIPTVVKPISVYYAPPLPPQTITPPQLVPQQTQLNFDTLPAALQSLGLLYPNLFQLPLMTQKTSQYLTRSELSAFKEVNDLRQAVSLILPMLPLYAQVPSNLSAAAAQLAAQQQPILTQNLMRKRNGMQTPNGSQLADCPVSMRTALNASSVPFLLNQFLMTPMGGPSPTLPTANLATLSGGGVDILQQLPTVDEQAVNKWSSPSSVDSNGQKTDSSTVSASDSHNIDIVGDGSESSSTSTASAQDQLQMHLINAVQQKAFAEAFKVDRNLFLQQAATHSADQSVLRGQPMHSSSLAKPTTIGPERKQRKPVNDDIVKIVRNQDLSAEAVAEIEIPVHDAYDSDPSFKPVTEQQIIQQIVQGKKYEEMEVGECMIQLCKKLAEKRVFGPRLMSQTTVAGLNHSNYSNLPIQGICYIQHVCWKVLRDKFNHEEEFWDKFREAMRKLAARCRRVRHAKKTKSSREEAQNELMQKRIEHEHNISFKPTVTHTFESLGLNRQILDSGLSIPTTSESSNLTQILLQNFANSKVLKDEDSSIALQSLLRLKGSGDFGVKQETLSPM